MMTNRAIIISALCVFAAVCCAQMTEKDQGRFGLAQSFNNTGNHVKAAEILEDLYKRFPGDRKVAVEYGKALAYGGRAPEGLPVLAELLEKEPGDEYVARTLASAYEIAKKPAEARKIYLKLLKKSPDDLDLVLKTANASIWMKDFADAAERYKKALELEPDNVLHMKGLAKALAEGDRAQEALPVLVKILKKTPNDEYVMLTLASAYEGAKKPEEARQLYVKLLKKSPDDIGLVMKTANTSMWLKDYSDAAERYKKAMKLEPGKVKHMKALAKALYADGKTDEAENMYRKVLERTPDDQESIVVLTNILMAAGKYREVLVLLDKQPDTREVMIKRADLRQATGDHAGAAEIYRQVLAKKDDPALRMKMANSLFAIGKLVEAEAAFNAVMAGSPDDPEVLKQTANVMLAQRKYGQALKLARKLQADHPQDREINLLLARVLSLRRKYDESASLYQSIIAANPDWPEPRRELARVLGWARKYSKSIEAYKTLVRKFPDNEAMRLEMEGKKNWYRRFTSQAEKAYLELIVLEPENYEALFDLAQIYSMNGRWKSAVNAYARVQSIYPADEQTKRAAKKAEAYMSGWSASAGYRFTDAESSSRQVEKKISAAGISLGRELPANLSARVSYRYADYDYTNSPGITRNDVHGAVSYSFLPGLLADVEAGADTFSEGIDTAAFLAGLLKVSPHDMVDLNFIYERDVVDENRDVLLEEIDREEYRARIDAALDRRLTARGHYFSDDYSDGNNRNGFRLDLKAQLLFEPRSLVLQVSHEEYGYDDESELYFSPEDFWFDELTLRWTHFIGKEELRWGSRQTYYTLGYTFNRDKFKEEGHTFLVGLHHDWTDTFSTDAEYTRIRYTDDDVYSADIWMIYADYQF